MDPGLLTPKMVDFLCRYGAGPERLAPNVEARGLPVFHGGGAGRELGNGWQFATLNALRFAGNVVRPERGVFGPAMFVVLSLIYRWSEE